MPIEPGCLARRDHQPARRRHRRQLRAPVRRGTPATAAPESGDGGQDERRRRTGRQRRGRRDARRPRPGRRARRPRPRRRARRPRPRGWGSGRPARLRPGDPGPTRLPPVADDDAAQKDRHAAQPERLARDVEARRLQVAARPRSCSRSAPSSPTSPSPRRPGRRSSPATRSRSSCRPTPRSCGRDRRSGSAASSPGS